MPFGKGGEEGSFGTGAGGELGFGLKGANAFQLVAKVEPHRLYLRKGEYIDEATTHRKLLPGCIRSPPPPYLAPKVFGGAVAQGIAHLYVYAAFGIGVGLYHRLSRRASGR